MAQRKVRLGVMAAANRSFWGLDNGTGMLGMKRRWEARTQFFLAD